MVHCVYIVECSDGTLYTGYTTDVGRRIGEHNAGDGAKYTAGRRPVTLRYRAGKDPVWERLIRQTSSRTSEPSAT